MSAVGSSPTLAKCEPSQVLLAGVSDGFSRGSPERDVKRKVLVFSPKHRLCVPTNYVVSKNKKNIKIFRKNLYISWASFHNVFQNKLDKIYQFLNFLFFYTSFLRSYKVVL